MARGSIDRRDNGRYRARHEGPDGLWHSRTFDRKSDAERWLTDQLSRTSHGTWIDPNAGLISFDEYSSAWLAAKSRLKSKTRQGYLSLLRSRILPTFGEWRLVAIDRVQVGSWVRTMVEEGLSSSRIRQAHQCLAAILEQAVADGLIGQNPARRVELPRQDQPQHRYLTANQVAQLAKAMPSAQYSTLVYVLAYGGLRWGELAALRRDRVDVLRRQLEVTEALAEISGRLEFGTTKTHRSRTAYLPRFVAEMLGERLIDVSDEPGSLVFTAPGGGPLRYANVRRRIWNPARARAGGDLAAITPHDLRHTCASLMRAAGADVKAIQQQLGHRNATVTLDTYTHLFEGDLAEIMERLDVYATPSAGPAQALGEVVDLHDTARIPR